MPSTELEVLKFLKILEFHLYRGKRAYADYMENGKLFKYAIIIKNNNQSIHRIIMSEGYLVPSHLKDKLIDIVSHIDLWLVYWENLKDELNPDLNDEFVFENEFGFPKASEKALIEYQKSLIRGS